MLESIRTVSLSKVTTPAAIDPVPVIVGLVNVLLANVSTPSNVAKVPVVGSVIFVAPAAVKFVAYAPVVDKFPPNVNVLAPLLTPVPPYVGLTIVPCQTPVPIVPTEVKLDPVTPVPKLEALNT